MAYLKCEVPDDLLHRFKVLAATRRTTMRALLLAAIRTLVDTSVEPDSAKLARETLARLRG